jgi:hypothetical protein
MKRLQVIERTSRRPDRVESRVRARQCVVQHVHCALARRAKSARISLSRLDDHARSEARNNAGMTGDNCVL